MHGHHSWEDSVPNSWPKGLDTVFLRLDGSMDVETPIGCNRVFCEKVPKQDPCYGEKKALVEVQTHIGRSMKVLAMIRISRTWAERDYSQKLGFLCTMFSLLKHGTEQNDMVSHVFRKLSEVICQTRTCSCQASLVSQTG